MITECSESSSRVEPARHAVPRADVDEALAFDACRLRAFTSGLAYRIEAFSTCLRAYRPLDVLDQFRAACWYGMRSNDLGRKRRNATASCSDSNVLYERLLERGIRR